ncbi:MAG: serine/threonine protein kinase [Anaerolineae bacterium]|nr:serine/threonine protein kinase [Anaerolineae bacterium]NUQ06672.1 serine/threonine protein kinase [Anaerolineae bacterium]
MSTSSLIGKKLGKYQVTRLLGQGGMATVYVAHQDDIDRDVAIKVLPPHPGQDTRFIERFRLEARTIARLQHPHILPVYDYGDEGDVLYLVMAYVSGGTLADRLRKGPLRVVEADRLMHEIGGALDYAHRQNVVHRDVKPANILLDQEGHALLTDFGIVKLMEAGAALTGTGAMVGTPSYMSPEQAQSVEIDQRSDLYSLGVVGYEMLTGRQPFNAETAMQIVLKQISAAPPLDNLAPPFVGVIGRALEKSPEARYQTVAEFVEAFSQAAHSEAAHLSPARSTASLNDATVEAVTPFPVTPYPKTPYPPPTADDARSPAAYATRPDAPAQTGAGQSSGAFMPPPTGAGTTNPPPTMVVTQQGTNPLVLLGGFAIIAVLLVVVVLLVLNSNRPPGPAPDASSAPPQDEPTRSPDVVVVTAPTAAPAPPTFGRVSFSSVQAPGDTVSLRADNFTPAPQGRQYAAWMINTETGDVLLLGTVRIDPLGAGALSYTSEEGISLPTHYNALLITAEETPGAAPSDEVVYSGAVPLTVASALAQILQESPDGLPPRSGSGANTSLIEGAISEANIAKQHAGLAARATSVGSMKTHAEHTINALRGLEAQEDLDGSGRADNPGRGIGVPFFLDHIDQQLATITESPEASVQLQSQVELIRVCILNTRGWMQEVIVRERALLASDSLEAVQRDMEESTHFADAMVDGIDLNGNGQVEPFEGECGLSQIIDFGIAVANFGIVEGDLQPLP